MLLTDLLETKALLGISASDSCEDKLLNFLIEMASNWIEEWLGRKLGYALRTEYYGGSDTIKLLLKSRPVYATGLIVKVDDSGFYGTPTSSFSDDALVYGTDYCLDIDQDDGTSRSGILIRINKVWAKSYYWGRGWLAPWKARSQGTIKVTYNAGYTVDNLPPIVRLAAATLVARMRYMLPLGMELNSDSYEAKSIGIMASDKNYLFSNVIRPMLLNFRNWTS